MNHRLIYVGKPVPHYVNGFIAWTIDKAIKILASKCVTEAVKALHETVLNIFLKSLFLNIYGNNKRLYNKITINHKFISKKMVKINEHSSIPFLYTTHFIKEGRITTDLYLNRLI